ncbi:hypothetical protein [Hyella patelloides]|nr:hypothetical protein [Hyella patelloides]
MNASPVIKRQGTVHRISENRRSLIGDKLSVLRIAIALLMQEVYVK